ncbi:hypothetical protein JX265_008957 [Neoarthrinium moseri]|uniref:Uncharacterized protein n=1 Tax=Neoarthrinium moseri TaxID=1658444 RepID=A0A9Q0ALZ3_9PEZI|nr:hypothetical protein JX266_007312 [Neoarthrinium moseri]KAI1862911.1 hypothetical protein JX265_008957 [Neoarthrinium moseri]
MDHHRLPRRSQSHGTLHSSYARHGRPLHKPLRSVNENSALLPSPGALESMLKTTTETGDIGLFSIKSVPISRVGPPASRRDAMGHGLQSLPRHTIDESKRHDGRRRPPRHRDVTAEIISMYGSNSQSSSSVTSTLAYSTDEPGQRSYSMTTVGSKQLSHNKSNATLQKNWIWTSQTPLSTRPSKAGTFGYPLRGKPVNSYVASMWTSSNASTSRAAIFANCISSVGSVLECAKSPSSGQSKQCNIEDI